MRNQRRRSDTLLGGYNSYGYIHKSKIINKIIYNNKIYLYLLNKSCQTNIIKNINIKEEKTHNLCYVNYIYTIYIASCSQRIQHIYKLQQ